VPSDDTSLQFGSYRLHPVQGLTKENREIHITPKSLAVLYALARRSGEIVTKKELFESAWPDRLVTDAALSSCIRELRKALGDDARNPQYLETVHRRGFRFLATCADTVGDRLATEPVEPAGKRYENELDALGAFLDPACDGPVQIGAIVGAVGSGKSALVDALLAQVVEGETWQVGRGRCDELSGRGDAYRVLLDALTALCLQPGGAQMVSQLRLHAPTWLGELTTVLQPSELAAQRLITSGVTTARLHRELDAVLAATARQRPLMLILEDLQWSDEGTLDWLTGLEDRVSGSIVVLATYTADARFDTDFTLQLESEAAGKVGNFDDLDELGRRVLETAGIIGAQFSDIEVASILDLPRQAVAEALSELVAAGELVEDTDKRRGPGDAGSRIYYFNNRLHQARLVEALPVLDKRRLHRRIARYLETSLGESATDRSPELAVRYEQAYEVASSVRNLHDAASLCRRRGMHRIAHAHLRRALALLPGIPDSTERNLWDAQLQVAIGGDVAAEKGLADDDVGACFERALELAEDMPTSQRLYTILWRTWVFYFHRGPVAKAHVVASRLSEVAGALDDPALELSAHHAFWGTALILGDIREVLRHTNQAMALCGSGLDGAGAITNGCTFHDSHISNHHAAVCAGFCGAWATALAGDAQGARRSVDAAVAHARDFGHPFSLAMALVQSAGALSACDDAVNVRRYAEEAASIAGEHGFDVFQAWAAIYGGWAAARLGSITEGLEAMYDGLAALRGSGLWLFRPYQLALAAALELENAMYDAAARSLDEAFSTAERVGDRLAAAELHRLRGEYAIATARSPDHLEQAVHDIRAGLDIATASGAEQVKRRAERSLERIGQANVAPRNEPTGIMRSVTEIEYRRRGRDT
jgi:DNA-binding winged helix-turn-helix (wHTH) protein